MTISKTVDIYIANLVTMTTPNWQDKGESVFDVNAGKRINASTYLNMPSHWNGDVIETYIAFKNEKSTLVSDSCYTGQLVL